jgi:hypothetical protein
MSAPASLRALIGALGDCRREAREAAARVLTEQGEGRLAAAVGGGAG